MKFIETIAIQHISPTMNMLPQMFGETTVSEEMQNHVVLTNALKGKYK
jgi:hypothetical protein